MSGTRDRWGLLLPLPALLVTGSARAQEPSSGRAGLDPAERTDVAEPGPTATLPEGAPLPEDLEEAKALYDRGLQAFEAGDYRSAGEAFEQVAGLAPGVTIHLSAAIAFRHAAVAEPDAAAASALCQATRRHAETVAQHPQASPEQIEAALGESAKADAHCVQVNTYEFSPCLSVVEPPVGPCLVPPHDPETRGCAHRREGPTAMLGAVMLLGLRSRRRRDAVEAVADRLPPDVVARLRRRDE